MKDKTQKAGGFHLKTVKTPGFFFDCGGIRCLSRCETVRRMRGEVDLSAAEEPLVLRYGTLVVYLALPDNDRAAAVIQRIL